MASSLGKADLGQILDGRAGDGVTNANSNSILRASLAGAQRYFVNGIFCFLISSRRSYSIVKTTGKEAVAIQGNSCCVYGFKSQLSFISAAHNSNPASDIQQAGQSCGHIGHGCGFEYFSSAGQVILSEIAFGQNRECLVKAGVQLHWQVH